MYGRDAWQHEAMLDMGGDMWDGGPGAQSGMDELAGLVADLDPSADELDAVESAVQAAFLDGYAMAQEHAEAAIELANSGGYSPPGRMPPAAELALANEVARDAVRRGEFEVAIRARLGAREHTGRAAVELAGSIRDPLVGTYTSACGQLDETGRCGERYHQAGCHAITEATAANGTPESVRQWNQAIVRRAGTQGASGVSAWDAVRASAGYGNVPRRTMYGDVNERDGIPINSYVAARDVASWRQRLGLADDSLSPEGRSALGQLNRSMQNEAIERQAGAKSWRVS